MPEELNDQVSESVTDGAESGEELDPGFITAEKKPFNRSSLMIFVVLLLGLGGVMLMRSRTGPSTAIAANPEADDAKQTIVQFLSEGTSRIKLMQEALHNTERVMAKFNIYPASTQVPLDKLQTNPFCVDPVEKKPKAEDPEKALKLAAEQKAAALAQIRKLKLESIMYSSSQRICMINGQPYAEGQTIDSVTIQQITPSAIVVECNGFKFQMKTAR